MADPYIDINLLKANLATFFEERKDDLARFGSTVNQTFEAYVFASTVAWYRQKSGTVLFVHPKDEDGNVRTTCHLKFSTSGAPSKYSFAKCSKGRTCVQVRHQLRVATAHYKPENRYRANICLDVAVIKDVDLAKYASNDQLSNKQLITFGEAKHMSAFAELIAGFLGMVHELQPNRLSAGPHKRSRHLPPFLYVSGWLNGTALGLEETIRQRGFDLKIFTVDRKLGAVPIKITAKRRRAKAAVT
jgi:hypothetical protein